MYKQVGSLLDIFIICRCLHWTLTLWTALKCTKLYMKMYISRKWRRHDAAILSAAARRSVMTSSCGVSKTSAAAAAHTFNSPTVYAYLFILAL